MKNLLMFFLVLVVIISFFACSKTTKEEEFIENGIEKHKLGDYADAIKDYNKAIKLNPEYAEAYVVRGMAKILLGDRKGGLEDSSKAEELGFGEEEADELIKKIQTKEE